MYWPTESERVPLDDLGMVNTLFLATCKTPNHSMVQWGTTFCVDNLDAFVKDQREALNLLVSPAHVLLLAVARTVAEHPDFNRRIIGRRVVRLKEMNFVMPVLRTRQGEID